MWNFAKVRCQLWTPGHCDLATFIILARRFNQRRDTRPGHLAPGTRQNWKITSTAFEGHPQLYTSTIYILSSSTTVQFETWIYIPRGQPASLNKIVKLGPRYRKLLHQLLSVWYGSAVVGMDSSVFVSCVGSLGCSVFPNINRTNLLKQGHTNDQ